MGNQGHTFERLRGMGLGRIGRACCDHLDFLSRNSRKRDSHQANAQAAFKHHTIAVRLSLPQVSGPHSSVQSGRTRPFSSPACPDQTATSLGKASSRSTVRQQSLCPSVSRRTCKRCKWHQCVSVFCLMTRVTRCGRLTEDQQ